MLTPVVLPPGRASDRTKWLAIISSSIATNGKVDLSFAKTGKLVFKTAWVRDMAARTLDDGSILVASNDFSTTDDPLGNPDDEVNYDTFNIKFNAGGQNSYKNVLVEQIQSGQIQTVWPPEVAAATPVYPTPTWTARFGLPPQPPKAKLPGTGMPPRG